MVADFFQEGADEDVRRFREGLREYEVAQRRFYDVEVEGTKELDMAFKKLKAAWEQQDKFRTSLDKAEHNWNHQEQLQLKAEQQMKSAQATLEGTLDPKKKDSAEKALKKAEANYTAAVKKTEEAEATHSAKKPSWESEMHSWNKKKKTILKDGVVEYYTHYRDIRKQQLLSVEVLLQKANDIDPDQNEHARAKQAQQAENAKAPAPAPAPQAPQERGVAEKIPAAKKDSPHSTPARFERTPSASLKTSLSLKKQKDASSSSSDSDEDSDKAKNRHEAAIVSNSFNKNPFESTSGSTKQEKSPFENAPPPKLQASLD